MQLTAVFFAILVSCLGAAYSAGCGDSLYADMTQCYQSAGLDIGPKPTTNDVKEIISQIGIKDVDCGHLDAVKDASGCFFELVEKCLAGSTGGLPNIAKFKAGLDFMCQKQNDIDMPCVLNKAADIGQCAAQKMIPLLSKPGAFKSVDDTICLANDAAYDCSAQYLKNCPKDTKAIYLTILDKYTVPRVCAGGRNGAASLAPLFHPFSATLVATATLIFLRWSG